MGFNISGIAINANFEDRIEELQNILGLKFEKLSDINFETASSNNNNEEICDIYFTENGTLIFLYIDNAEGYGIADYKSLAFAISETAMAFNLCYCEDGREVRSIMEVNGERLLDVGDKLDVESDSDDTSEIIFSQISEVIGKNFWYIDPAEKSIRFKIINSAVQTPEDVNFEYKNALKELINKNANIYSQKKTEKGYIPFFQMAKNVIEATDLQELVKNENIEKIEHFDKGYIIIIKTKKQSVWEKLIGKKPDL